MGVLISKLNANIAYTFNGKISKLLKAKSIKDLKIPYSVEFYWYWQIFSKLWQNGSKYWTLNILNIRFKDSVLTALMTH